jgi:MerR family copper efflux transcriptional regulator
MTLSNGRMDTYRIKEVTEVTGLSADTLRYYEKIKLLPKVQRNASGIRVYKDKDISRLRFIQRAQKMNFSLEEIKKLMSMRENPQKARKNARTLAQQKLTEVKEHLKDLTTLRNELTLLVNLCGASENGCPIIESMEKGKANNKQ